MSKIELCRDAGDRPGCLNLADDRFTLRFDDIGEPPLHWCAKCGPEAHARATRIHKALVAGGDGFADRLLAKIEEAEAAELGGRS